MRSFLMFSLLTVPALAYAGGTQKAVSGAVRAEYVAQFGNDIFSATSLHAYTLASVKLKGNQYSGTFKSTIAARNANMGAGMPQFGGSYKLASGKYTITIDPLTR
jgi:hypothetical protein